MTSYSIKQHLHCISCTTGAVVRGHRRSLHLSYHKYIILQTSHMTIFYQTASTLYCIDYRCFTTIWCYLSHSVSLKLHTQLVLITFTLLVQ